MAEELTEEQRQANELEKLLANSPYALPDDPSSSGWSAQQNKKMFWMGYKILYKYLVVERARITSLEESGVSDLQTAIQNIIAGTSLVAKATGDKDGNEFSATYAKIVDLRDGAIGVLKYINNNGTLSNINALETAQDTLAGALQAFITNVVDGSVQVGSAANADSATKAVRDQNGNIIHTTYATVVALSAVQALFTKLENGTTASKKAYMDQNGDVIDRTYLKIANIINDLTHTDTNKALSAYQGYVLLQRVIAIENLLQSDDTSLDELQEIVNFVKNNKSLIDGITANKVSVSDIIANYNTNVANKPLAASVGYTLYNLITALNSDLTTGELVVKEAEKATKDGDGNNIADTYVKSVNGATPQNGNVDVAGVLVVSDYDNSTGKIAISATGMTLSYDSSTGILTIE